MDLTQFKSVIFNTTTGIKTSSTFDGLADYYVATIVSYSDYDPFGTMQDGRTIPGDGTYRFGFQGQEMDNEIKGRGNSYNYEYLMHDPRLGRFFAVDPLAGKYPHNSPYAFSENVVINAVELEGLELSYNYNVYSNDNGKTKKVKKSHDSDNKKNFNERVYNYYNSQGQVWKTMTQKLDSKGKTVKTTYAYPLQEQAENEYYQALAASSGYHYDGSNESYDPTNYDNMEGGDDGGNTGGALGGQKGWDNGGKQLFFGTIGLVTLPITLAGTSTYGLVTGVVGGVDAADDVIGVVFVPNDKSGSVQSLSQYCVSSENAKQNVAKVKAVVGLFSLFNGTISTSQAAAVGKGTEMQTIAGGTGIFGDVIQAPDAVEDLSKKSKPVGQ